MSDTGTFAAPVVPDYRGPCIAGLVPAILSRHSTDPGLAWLPAEAKTAEQVVLLVLDGLGWEQLRQRPATAPWLCAMSGGPIASVVPTTTATALTSIATGTAPAKHGIVGYRLRVDDDEVLNVLRWTAGGRDVRHTVDPTRFQPVVPFAGINPIVVTKAEFAATGFTTAHLRTARLRGWPVPSTLGVEIRAALAADETFVYAYYDGIDRVAHRYGFGEHYEAELRFVDWLVEDLCRSLPLGAALLVTADHGQVAVGPHKLTLPDKLLNELTLLSGEGRFRWLHTRPGGGDSVLEQAHQLYDDVAWVHTRQELIAECWFGGPLAPEVEHRLGDVALIARDPIAFTDPADTGENALVCRHGSLTPAEVWVPLLAWAP
jgi:predicted AlkP superfamily pyrophosphatase or phosphodiesterase